MVFVRHSLIRNARWCASLLQSQQVFFFGFSGFVAAGTIQNHREKLFENIKRGPLQVPQDMPSDALDLIVKLLNRDPRARLGAGPGDAEEIKAHPFFAGVDWDKVMARGLKLPKPIVKPIVNDGATFDGLMDKEADDDSKLNKWTFVSPEFGP